MARPARLSRGRGLPCVVCGATITGNSAAQQEDQFALCIDCRIAGYVMTWTRDGSLALDQATTAGAGPGARRVLREPNRPRADSPTPSPSSVPAPTPEEEWADFFAGLSD